MPRAKIHASGTERWRTTEAKRKATGAVRKSFVFSATVAECLAVIRDNAPGLSDTEIVGTLIIDAEKKLRRKQKPD